MRFKVVLEHREIYLNDIQDIAALVTMCKESIEWKADPSLNSDKNEERRLTINVEN